MRSLCRSVQNHFRLISAIFGYLRLPSGGISSAPTASQVLRVQENQNRKFPDKNTPGSFSGHSVPTTYNKHFRTMVRFSFFLIRHWPLSQKWYFRDETPPGSK